MASRYGGPRSLGQGIALGFAEGMSQGLERSWRNKREDEVAGWRATMQQLQMLMESDRVNDETRQQSTQLYMTLATEGPGSKANRQAKKILSEHHVPLSFAQAPMEQQEIQPVTRELPAGGRAIPLQPEINQSGQIVADSPQTVAGTALGAVPADFVGPPQPMPPPQVQSITGQRTVGLPSIAPTLAEPVSATRFAPTSPGASQPLDVAAALLGKGLGKFDEQAVELAGLLDKMRRGKVYHTAEELEARSLDAYRRKLGAQTEAALEGDEQKRQESVERRSRVLSHPRVQSTLERLRARYGDGAVETRLALLPEVGWEQSVMNLESSMDQAQFNRFRVAGAATKALLDRFGFVTRGLLRWDPNSRRVQIKPEAGTPETFNRIKAGFAQQGIDLSQDDYDGLLLTTRDELEGSQRGLADAEARTAANIANMESLRESREARQLLAEEKETFKRVDTALRQMESPIVSELQGVAGSYESVIYRLARVLNQNVKNPPKFRPDGAYSDPYWAQKIQEARDAYRDLQQIGRRHEFDPASSVLLQPVNMPAPVSKGSTDTSPKDEVKALFETGLDDETAAIVGGLYGGMTHTEIAD